MQWKTVLIVLLGLLSTAQAQGPYDIREGLYSGSSFSRGSGRSAVFLDRVMHAIAAGTWQAPREGDLFGTDFRGDELRWRKVTIEESGVISGDRLRGGYVYLTCHCEDDEIAILRTNGNSEVFVNGSPRAGDYYGNGWIILPIQLRQGTNEFLYHLGRSRSQSFAIERPPQPIYLTDVDMTLPDLLTSEVEAKQAAIRIVNASTQTLRGLSIVATIDGVAETTPIAHPIAPLTTHKAPFTLYDGENSSGDQASPRAIVSGWNACG